MSIERVRAYFASLGIEDKVREFEVSSATKIIDINTMARDI